MYRVEFDDSAAQDLARLGTKVVQRISNKLRWLAQNCDIVRHEALTEKRFKGSFKLRVGDYRVIYSLDRRVRAIRVQEVGHRSEIYD